jgi:hypothetical protein
MPQSRLYSGDTSGSSRKSVTPKDGVWAGSARIYHQKLIQRACNSQATFDQYSAAFSILGSSPLVFVGSSVGQPVSVIHIGLPRDRGSMLS